MVRSAAADRAARIAQGSQVFVNRHSFKTGTTHGVYLPAPATRCDPAHTLCAIGAPVTLPCCPWKSDRLPTPIIGFLRISGGRREAGIWMQAQRPFSLVKWYMDCVTDAGEAAILLLSPICVGVEFELRSGVSSTL